MYHEREDYEYDTGVDKHVHTFGSHDDMCTVTFLEVDRFGYY